MTEKPCVKVRYATFDEAEAALVAARVKAVLRNNQRRKEKRVYACRNCEGFHLTSQPGRRESAA